MTDTKPLASLGPSLLARKGAARPAMRPQFSSLMRTFQPEMDDDLGWNEMGHDPDDQASPRAAEVLPLTPAAPPARTERAPEPEVRRQQRKVADAMAPEPRGGASAFASLHSIKPRRSAFEQGRRAAFTLRLDAERHMKLRLATAAQGRSAQQLVTEALDRFLDGIPELDSLAARLKRD